MHAAAVVQICPNSLRLSNNPPPRGSEAKTRALVLQGAPTALTEAVARWPIPPTYSLRLCHLARPVLHMVPELGWSIRGQPGSRELSLAHASVCPWRARRASAQLGYNQGDLPDSKLRSPHAGMVLVCTPTQRLDELHWPALHAVTEAAEVGTPGARLTHDATTLVPAPRGTAAGLAGRVVTQRACRARTSQAPQRKVSALPEAASPRADT